jgi:hypothetical protein
MFKKAVTGDYFWEILPNIILHYSDDRYSSTDRGNPMTSVYIDNTIYPLMGDFRKMFIDTEGDLKRIKQVYLDNITSLELPITDYASAMLMFSEHIDQYIK